METYSYAKAQVHTEALDAALKAAVPQVKGISTADGVIRVHSEIELTPAMITAVDAIIAAHDPVRLQLQSNGSTYRVHVVKPHNVDLATELTLTFNGVAADAPTELIMGVGQQDFQTNVPVVVSTLDYPTRTVRVGSKVSKTEVSINTAPATWNVTAASTDFIVDRVRVAEIAGMDLSAGDKAVMVRVIRTLNRILQELDLDNV